jgi:hypothetical protein
MNTLATQTPAPAPLSTNELQTDNLNELLQTLRRFGKPTVTAMDRGWWVYIDVHVSAIGTSMKVDSEITQGAPIVAARQCAERLVDLLKKWEGK